MTPGGFDPDAPTRGSRNPSLTSMLDAETLGDDDTEGVAGANEYLLLEGDVIMAKVTQATANGLGDAWVTFGAQTRVMAGEDEAHAFDRLATITNARVLDMVGDLEARASVEAEQRAIEARQHRIPSARQ